MTATARATEAEGKLVAELARLEDGIVPGGVAVVATADEILFERAFGRRALEPEPEDATSDTLWDCASVTKALVTASCLLVLRGRGEMSFHTPVSEILVEFSPVLGMLVPRRRTPTVGELLLHAGGMPAWEPLYALAGPSLESRTQWLSSHREPPGHAAVYGCPGYQVLGHAIERWTGETLAAFAAKTLWPDRDDLFMAPPRELAGRCAPTERGNEFERELAGARARGYSGFRTELIRGQVHDHNAFTVGGAAGNAGLFGTGRGVSSLASRFLRENDLFSATDLAELSTELSPPPRGEGGERRTWGFQLARSGSSPAGGALSDRAFGHAGFTGTSVMIDPDRGATYVLLTNRVHPAWREHPFNEGRRRFHSAAAALVDARRG